MAREQNLFYQDPSEAIGAGLGRAFFGDPQARAQQAQIQSEAALREAQMQEARAHGGLYNAQADGIGVQTEAARNLPQLFAGMIPHPAAPPVAVGDNAGGTPGFDAAFDSSVGPAARVPSAEEAFRAGLPAVLAAMGQMQGDKIDPTKYAGTLASFLGGDELARRGMVAQGHSPAADFAITPERADQIAAIAAGEKRKTAWGVASIDHASDIPVANIQAGASRYSADQRLAGSKYGADARVASAGARGAGGAAPGFDAITAALPGATMTSGLRTPERNWQVGGVRNSNHLGLRSGVQAYDIPVQPGMTIDQAAARIEQANGGRVRVVEKLQHRATRPDGSQGGLHWHFALESEGGAPPAGGRGAPALKPVSAAAAAMMSAELNTQLGARNWKLDPAATARTRAAAMSEYQRTGNPVAAVLAVLDGIARHHDQNANTARSMAAMGARQAPDGNW